MTKKLYITDEVNVDMYVALSREMNKAYADDVKSITLVINSPGGDAYSALAIYDLIQSYKEHDIKFNTLGTGVVASAATLILAVGDKRALTKNAWVMVHEDVTEASRNDRVSTVERKAKHARQLENQWNKLLAKHTKLDAFKWESLNVPETYLTPEECLEYGLVDEVI